MPPHLHHVQLALYADDTAVIATSRKPTQLVSYLQSYLNELQRWLSEWSTAINVSKSTAIIFARTRRRFSQPTPVRLFVEPIEWVDKTRYLGVTLHTRLTCPPHIDQVRKRTAQRMGMLRPLLNRKSNIAVRGEILYKQVIRPMRLCLPCLEVRCPLACPEATGVAFQVSSPC
jgi:hypothetical protein